MRPSVVVTVLAAILGWVWLFGNTGCAALSAHHVDNDPPRPTPLGEPIILDEPKVRSEAPDLAALLDKTLVEGSATESKESRARAMYDYLLREAHCGGVVGWRGATFETRMAVS